MWWPAALFSLISLMGLALDLATKHYIFAWRGLAEPGGPREIYWLLEGWFGIETTTNPGALFGLGAGYVHFFSAISFVAIGGILFWVIRWRRSLGLLMAVALGLVLAGIIGNLYDRLGLWTPPGGGPAIHEVRDWILLEYYGRPWPNFNLADTFLVCGAGLLLVQSLRTPRSPEKR